MMSSPQDNQSQEDSSQDDSLQDISPQNSRKRTRTSRVWQFFIITDDRVKCTVNNCGKTYQKPEQKKGTSTATLAEHLRKKHSISFGLVSKRTEELDEKNLLLNLILKTNCSFSLLDNRVFQTIAKSNIHPYSSTTMKHHLGQRCEETQKNIRGELEKVSICSIITDTCHKDHQYIFGVLVYFLDNFVPHVRPLCFRVLKKHPDSNYIKKKIEDINNEYKLHDKLYTINCDGGSDFNAACNQLNVKKKYCFNHILNLAVQEFLFSDGVTGLFSKLRSICDFFKRTDVCLEDAEETQEEFVDENIHTPKTPPTYSHVRWLSSMDLFAFTLFNVNKINNIFENINIRLRIQEGEKATLKKCTYFLAYLREIHCLFQDKKTSGFCTVMPLMLRIQSFISKELHNVDDNDYTSGLTQFRRKFREKYNFNYNTLCNHLAPMFDPRNRNLKYLNNLKSLGYDQKDVTEKQEFLREKLRIKFETNSSTQETEQHQEETSNPFLYDDDEDLESFSEIDEYLSLANTRVNAFDWWRENCQRYPILSKLAKRYLTIPATSSFIESTWSVAKPIVDQKNNISDELLERLLFLKQYELK